MIDAALLLDKPVGLSSNAALQRVKRLFGARKAGHGGTLDPLASGLLVILFGEATKFAGSNLGADKEYLATLKLGVSTATGDAEGEVLEEKAVDVPPGGISSVLDRFRGAIDQVPPMYSALKRDGVPLYQLARRGERVERCARRIEISELEQIRFEAPFLELRVRCSKGTYLRSLAEDIGCALGTVAHLTALRRTASGRFDVRDAVTLDALERLPQAERGCRLLPLAALLGDLPRAELDQSTALRFRQGRPVSLPGAPDGPCAVYGPGGALIGLGAADAAGQLRPLRLLAASSQAAEKHQKTL